MELLKTENITKKYDGKTVISDINIELHHGELVSLLGVSGAGKTTLFNVISGLIAPEEGRVLLDGQDITGSAGHVSYMLQKDLLLDHKKIIDNVSLPLRIRGCSREEARQKAEVHFAEFGLDGTQYRYPGQLSGGMRQRAALLRTYLASEGTVLLDEPFSALDAITKSSMHEWYLNVMKQIDLSTLLITHDIDEAILLSDRIYILGGSPGRIKGEIIISKNNSGSGDFALSEQFLEYKKTVISLLM